MDGAKEAPDPDEAVGNLTHVRETTDSTLKTVPGPSRKLPVLITLDGKRITERFVIKRAQTVIGRDSIADIILQDGEVSRRHLILVWENYAEGSQSPRVLLKDLSSMNGTSVNGKKVNHVYLADGDQITAGSTLLGFYIKDERVLELDQQLLSLAIVDGLTGLYRRDFFLMELHREFERARRHNRPLSLLMLDLDNFKVFNDTHGHATGDAILKTIGDMVRMSLREGDISGRYGGEEFCVILPETPAEAAVEVAERLRKAIETGAQCSSDTGAKVHVTISIGVAARGDAVQNKMQLLQSADEALYEAKSRGRNRVVLASSAPELPPDITKPRS